MSRAAGRKRPIDAGEEHPSHRLATIVALAARRRVPWWELLTAEELADVLAAEDACAVPSILPGDLARTCAEVLGRRAIGTELALRRALRADYRRAAVIYTTRGDVRGECGHRHRTIAGALVCLDRDRRGCERHRGYSDRRVVRTDGADLSPGERDELAALALGAMEARGGALRRRGDRGRDGGAR